MVIRTQRHDDRSAGTVARWKATKPDDAGARLRKIRRLLVWTLAAILVALLVVPHLRAQTSVRLLPQVGAYSPLSELGEVREDGETLISAGRRSSSLAWGLGLEVGPATSGTSFRGHLGYGTNSEIPVGGFECPACSARSTLVTGGVAAVFRPIPRLVLVQPYFLLGAGLKRYDFDVRNADGDSWRRLFRDQTRPSGQLGVGLEASILGFRTQWELNGYVSRYRGGDSNGSSDGSGLSQSLQTDFFFTLSIPLGG